VSAEASSNELRKDEALRRSYGFPHLQGAQGGAWRLNRFDEVDLLLVVIPYWFHQLFEVLADGVPLRALGTLIAMCAAVYVLRTKFPDGLLPLVRVIGMPRRLSSLARDRGLQTTVRYPPASDLERRAAHNR
jgi:hypothetical protein